MDPLFGLPAMKDTKAMDAARARNKSYERHLVRTINTLDSELKTKSCKLQHTVSDLQQFMSNINPRSAKTIIYPRGLSDEQKHNYRVLRRGSIPSMSLDEFDMRMEVKREKRAQTRRRPKPEVEKEVEKIVDVDAHSFCAPFHKHRQTMREAYDRATSNDVRFSETKQDRSNKTDSHDLRSSSSGGMVLHHVSVDTQIRPNTICVTTKRRDDGNNSRDNNSTLDSRLHQMMQRGVNNLDSSEDED
ncbi:uncharacterized protein LOC124136249 [Haliotis rufescens]|uniref:uncharacterized protein LOC124136249 n=1 Tax=Haliotis rufescens TaxID=6454 RepID=UPI001EAFD4B7|nr:uncharacterized protein LOC124136249 [Haliotis rufescens]XP_046358077.1 uncharacterized protein LOC124136249 [Haliotis rufescens]